MAIQEWNKFLLPYEQAVEELKIKFKGIRNALRKAGEYSPIEFTTGRVKKISSILEKAKKMEIGVSDIENKMEDIAGIRIICQMVEDIYRVVDLVKQRDGRDLSIINEKDYVKNTKPSGYRSYHIIISYPVQTAQGEKKILAEIQIRTLAMNFWATIEHSLNYKYKHNLPEDVKKRLISAAEAAFSLDEEMSAIHHEVVGAQKTFQVKSHLVSAILQGINTLYFSGKNEEVFRFQERFNYLLSREENDLQFKQLADEVSASLANYGLLPRG